MAVNSVAGMLSESGTTFSSDEDPELVRDAVPFAIKLYESLLESVPENQDLLRATCSVFTQYAYAFVQTDAEIIEPDDFAASMAMKERALARLHEPEAKLQRYRAPDSLIDFLRTL